MLEVNVSKNEKKSKVMMGRKKIFFGKRKDLNQCQLFPENNFELPERDIALTPSKLGAKKARKHENEKKFFFRTKTIRSKKNMKNKKVHPKIWPGYDGSRER